MCGTRLSLRRVAFREWSRDLGLSPTTVSDRPSKLNDMRELAEVVAGVVLTDIPRLEDGASLMGD